jgi:hypothetical protein
LFEIGIGKVYISMFCLQVIGGSYSGYIGSVPITLSVVGPDWTLVVNSVSYFYTGTYPLIFTDVAVPGYGVGTINLGICSCPCLYAILLEVQSDICDDDILLEADGTPILLEISP